MIINETESQEREYLRKIIDIIKNAIRDVDASVKEHVNTLQEHKEYLWSNKDLDPHEIRSMRESILNHYALGENVLARRTRLTRLLDIPYFGRIDFREDGSGSETMAVYIGVHSFYDYKKKNILIYDWRAPVSGMFYDFELGEAFYTSVSGVIQGTILLKRQYRIRKCRMEFMIESSLTLHDEILQKELSASSDEKMKHVVTTIQREQNRIIRNEDAPVLIIQGVAGSGKTSIAMHRIAFLLYAFKGKITSKDMLILSPNKVFSDYISNVLPELGEDMVPETSMEQVLSDVFDHKIKFRHFSEQITELLGNASPECISRLQYKTSPDFVRQLDRYVVYLENEGFRAVDVKLTRDFTIPAAFIETQFRRFHRYPMRQRFEPMAAYILEMMEIKYRVSVSTIQRNLLKKEIRKMFSGNNDLEVYKAFFDWIGKPELFKYQKNRTLEYTDLAPLAYLHLALDGVKTPATVKHLLIDEMQDYSPIQYTVIQKLFPCRKTILGDVNQTVNPYGSSSAEMIRNIFPSGEVMKLYKSYRSTYEITCFAQKIKANEEVEAVERHGDHPQICNYNNEEEEMTAIVGFMERFIHSEFRSLGIICKDMNRAGDLFEMLKAVNPDITLLSDQSTAFTTGIILTSALMAKGLEFDEVIIPHADNRNYRTEMDRSMLYVSVTRAMHRLTLTFTGEVTAFV